MSYIYPWPRGTEISQEFGTNPGGVNPSGGHTGKDGALPVGTPLRAPGDGYIEIEGWMTDPTGASNPYWLTDGGGICLVLNCGPGQPSFVLGHLSETLVNVGQRVKKGDIIAKSGNTGKWTTGPHCHFEYIPDGFNLRDNTYGRRNPDEVCSGYWGDSEFGSIGYDSVITPGQPEVMATREVTTEGANVRVNPWSWADTAPGYEDGLSLGATLGVVGYVKGEEVTPGNDAWYKTKSGFYVWTNTASDDISGLAYLGAMAVPAQPAPVQLPAPHPVDPAPPVVETPKYDFELDFTTINGITVEKIPAQWYNYGEDFPERPAKAVCHWWNSLEHRPSIDSVINEFCYISTQKSPHFMVSDLRIIQVVSLKDRAFHAGEGGNDWVGIEIDPYCIEKNADGSYTDRALRIQANVRGLLEALKGKFGYKLSLTLHKDVPGAVTDCSDLVLADFDIPDVVVVEPTPVPPAPEVPGDPVVVIEPGTEMDDATIRKLIAWLSSMLDKE